ncbi:ferredoxin [Candidatus Woesearchaeota archaeon]|nr:ferredoxin [Candidatus Woesearchaeota archaeon]
MTNQKKRYRIIYDREGCIGAGACEVAAPKFWKIEDNGIATIIAPNAIKTETEEELEITEEELQENLDAAQACPVQVIKIIDKKTGKQLYP